MRLKPSRSHYFFTGCTGVKRFAGVEDNAILGLDHNCGHNVTGSVPPISGFSIAIRGMPGA